MGGKPTILVAEDDANDRTLLALAFQKAGASATVHFVQNAQEAIDYLEGKGPYGDRAHLPPPNLLVVDSTLPDMSGFELLAWVRRQPILQRMVVGVLSGSEYKPDMQEARALGASFYLTKPQNLQELVVIARQLVEKCAGEVPLGG
jgi:CheY-like chemotaxis protein